LRAGRELRVGVVGCGYWGAKHLRVLMSTPGVCDVVAIDDNPGRLAAVHDALPGVHIAGSLTEAMRDIDAAVVATPVHTHAMVAADLLDAGKHVLVEKPMTATTAEARMLIDLAYERGVVLMAGHTFEYNAAVQMLKELIRSDELGTVYYIDTARLNLGIYRTDVNVVWDLAAHDISIINMLLGVGPSEVQAWGSRHATAGQEDVGYVRLGYGDLGVTAQVHVSWLDPCKVRRVTVVGSKRMAVYNDLDDEKRLRVYDKGILVDDCPSGDVPLSYRYGGISCPHIDFSEPLANEDAHFVSCVVDGAPCQTDGYSGLAVVQALEAADLSLHAAEPISLEPILPSGLSARPRLTSVG
jgi:predicted dehydrogenase